MFLVILFSVFNLLNGKEKNLNKITNNIIMFITCQV